MLLARVFLGVTWHGISHTLEQVVFLPAIQQHPQEGGCAPSRMHVRAIKPMPTVTGIFEISGKMRRNRALSGQAVLLGRNCEKAAKMDLWLC